MPRPLFDVTVRGVALTTYGFTEWDTYDGLGLVTKGLIWDCRNIWYGPYTSTGVTLISTTWSLMASVSTTWSLCAGSSIQTTWTPFSTYNIEDC